MKSLPNNFSKLSIKHVQIDKAHLQMVVMVSVATVVVVFTLFAGQALLKQISYQNKVLALRSKADKTLQANVKSAQTLQTAYKAFDDSQESVLGNSQKNAKIVLDALPSKYDFPAVVSSISYLANISGVALADVSGTDLELTAEQQSISPKVVDIPFTLTVKGSYASVQNFVTNMQKSIRPFQIIDATFKGSESDMSMTINAKTFYQPEKQLQLKVEVVPSTTKKVIVKTSTATSATKGTTK